MKKARTLLTLFLAVLILAGMLAFGGLSAAAMGEPTGLYWSGTTGCWSPPAETISYYQVDLYLDGNYLTGFTTTATYADFSSQIANCGPGDYTFTVSSAFTEGPAWISTAITSPVYHYEDPNAGCSHNLVSVPFSYPTCTEDGEKGHYECTLCGEWFWDSSANNPISDHSETVTPKLGHSWGDWVIVKEPTTEKEGTARRVCQNDASHVETMTLEKLKDGENITIIEQQLPDQANKKQTEKKSATEAVKATETTAETQASTLPALSPKDAQKALSLFENAWILTLIIIIGSIVLIIAIVIIIIVVVKKNKKKKEEDPSIAYPPGNYPPMNQRQGNYPPTNQPPTNYPPTNQPPTNYPPTNQPPANYPPTNQPPTNYPPTNQPPTNYPPKNPPAGR